MPSVELKFGLYDLSILWDAVADLTLSPAYVRIKELIDDTFGEVTTGQVHFDGDGVYTFAIEAVPDITIAGKVCEITETDYKLEVQQDGFLTDSEKVKLDEFIRKCVVLIRTHAFTDLAYQYG